MTRAFPVVLGVAACAAPAATPTVPRPLAVEAGGGAVLALPEAGRDGERDRQRRGVGLPPLPPPPPVLSAPPSAAAPRSAGASPSSGLPVPGNALSRMSAVPASPLANPPIGAGRPW